MMEKKKVKYVLVIGNKVEAGEKEVIMGSIDELEGEGK